MRVKMKHTISGLHNGRPIPAAGDTFEVSDGYGAWLVEHGKAEVETTDAAPVETTEQPKPKPKARKKPGPKPKPQPDV